MDEEYEAFEITDWDLENEFNPNRVRKPLTKKQQIYGIFGGDDDSDDERPCFRGASKGRSTINFVSSGHKDYSNQSNESDNLKETVKTRQRPTSYTQNDPNFGKWEQFTKGIGGKLLHKMGYQPGKGLGKKLQGITTPVEANKRPGKGSLGLYGPENAKGPVTAEEIGKKTEEVELTKQLHQWKKRDGKNDVKYSYRTVEEINDENLNRKMQNEVSSVKVIDMTGPKQRILSGYHAIHQQATKPEDIETSNGSLKNFQLPELEHNINILVNMTEQEIIQTNCKIKYNTDTIENLKQEEESLAKTLDSEKIQIDIMENIIEMVGKLKDIDNLDDAASALCLLQKNYPEEYRMLKLADLALALVFPLMQKFFENWEPLKDPKYGIETLSLWRPLLESNVKQSEMDLYQQLLWEIWMPPVRKAALSWDPHYCDAFIDLLEKWVSLVPPWMLSNILDQLVFPKLQEEVDRWNPLTDTIPIHSWIHPWLPLMREKLEPLYSPIRQKIGNALKGWDPRDSSAKLILEPWKTVFSKGTMEAFVIAHILPKLALALQAFEVRPHHQQLDAWNWVFAWEDFLPVTSLVSLLEKHFFPKWLCALCTWLSQNPNFDEVKNWYLGWKSLFSENLFSQPVIKDFFTKALDIIKQASLSQEPINPTHFHSYYEPQAIPKVHIPPIPPTPQFSYQLSFKELIENKAKEKGIIFAPIPNRYYDSKQVYYFGNSILYIDSGKIFVYNEKTWVPTSLACLLDNTPCGQ